MAAITNVFPGAELIPSPWWGYPTIGAARRVRATILAVDHITDGLSNAADTTRWGIQTRNRSWTFCVDRSGHVVQSLDPVLHTPWTNGDVNQPNLNNPRIAAAVKSGLNLNEWVFATIECVGVPDGWPITDPQRESLRRIHLWCRGLANLPLNRETVIGHSEINSVDRRNCPTLPRERAQFWIDVIPAIPDTSTEDPEVIEQLRARIAELKDVADARARRIRALEDRRDNLLGQVALLEDEVEALSALNVPELQATIDQLRNRLKRIRSIARDALEE